MNPVRQQVNDSGEGSRGREYQLGDVQLVFDSGEGGNGAGYVMNEGADDGGWLPAEQYSYALQSTIFRLFGHTEIPMTDNDLA